MIFLKRKAQALRSNLRKEKGRLKITETWQKELANELIKAQNFKGMAKLIINGGKELVGDISISGSKNASLPIMTASLLTDKELCLTNVPNLSDVSTMRELLGSLGTEILPGQNECSFKLKTKEDINDTADYEIVKKMRASIIVLGPTLVRENELQKLRYLEAAQ